MIDLFKKRCGYAPNLTSPKTYCEKVLYDKLNNKDSIKVQLADKHYAKQYIQGKSEAKPIPDLEKMSFPFYLKANNRSGNVRIVHNDSQFINTIQKFKQDDRTPYGVEKGEWWYSKIPLKILKEPILKNIHEIKVFCFDGNPEYIYYVGEHKSFFDKQLNFIDVEQKVLDRHYKPSPNLPDVDYDKIKDCASKLSEDIPHIRVDFLVNEDIFFCEYTFAHWSGMLQFLPKEFDYELGEKWNL